MKNYQSLGHLDHAPLVYTMGVIAISLEKISDFIPEIQEAFRDEYPTFSKMQVALNLLQLTGALTSNIDHYVFNDPNRNWGFILNSQRIVFHTYEYEHFQGFGEKLVKILDKFKKITNLAFQSGVSFRQIDNIIPLAGEGLEECINEKYLPLDIFTEPAKTKFARQEHRVGIEQGQIFSRVYVFRDEPGPRIPQDITPYCVALDHSRIQQQVSPPYVLADFEAATWVTGKSEPFVSHDIVSKMDELHRYASMAFRDVMPMNAINKRRK